MSIYLVRPDHLCTRTKYLVTVLIGHHKQITLSFLIVGHKKFSPDTCFGLIKWLYRRIYVGCLDNIDKVVSNSSAVNNPQLVGAQDGSIVVPMYNWVRTLMKAP